MKINIDLDKCISCKRCVEICPANVYEMHDMPIIIDEGACTLCGVCADQCPVKAIELDRSSRPKVNHLKAILGDEVLADQERQLTDLLGLSKKPVGIKLLNGDDGIPEGFNTLTSPIRHCVSINMAALGAAIHLPGESHACSAAKAALGIAPLPEKVRSGKVPYMHGLASSESAAARTMSEVPKLSLGSTVGTLAAPLSSFPLTPDVVILTCTPRQAMWVANALIFQDGGPRITANFAGMQASCGDVTAVPLLTGNVNFSLGCYGCRSAGKLGEDEMYVGIPMNQMERVLKGLSGLRRAMGMLENGQGSKN